MPTALAVTANAIRGLAIDAVEAANSGHPGLPLGTADIAAVLWAKYLKFDPAAPTWPDRDRFILSAGHGSMLLYALLHLAGYDLPLDELKAFRQWGSRTAGHPEVHHTPGVETTTGPLGQGLANGVGMALAERVLAARYNRPGFEVVNHVTYVLASDGDLMEGISHEAAALAGHLGLGKLVVFWDDNGISIDGRTDLSFTEDTRARFMAYGWQVLNALGHDENDIEAAIAQALAEPDKPTLIACKTVIGFGSPNKAGTEHVHGSPLGATEAALTKQTLGLAPEPFAIDPAAFGPLQAAAARGADAHAAWQATFAAYAEAHPALAAEYQRVLAGELPPNWAATLPVFDPADKPIATRAASGKVLAAIVSTLPELLGGSADLTGSVNTKTPGAQAVTRADFGGGYIHYGVREHAMGSLMNGMTLHGGLRPFGGTFLVFSDYMRPAIRMAALMQQPAIYVFTHDSIGLGEDGPTHQPIEHLAALRAIPNVTVFRPADANETAIGWQVALENKTSPTALILTRQGLPILPAEQVANARSGGYILADSPSPRAILLATGSEVSIALAAHQQLAEAGIATRVVSLPSFELFNAQPAEYRDAVLPPHLTVRVAIEAATTFGWAQYVGPHGRTLGLDHFGASAPYQTLYREFGLTAEALVAAVRDLFGG